MGRITQLVLMLLCIICAASIFPDAALALDQNKPGTGVIEQLKRVQMTYQHLEADFQRRGADIRKSCDLSEWKLLEADNSALESYLNRITPRGSTRPFAAQAASIALSEIYEECDPPTRHFAYAIQEADSCRLESALDRLTKLRDLAGRYQQQLQRVRATGGFSRVKLATVQQYADQSKSTFETALANYNKAKVECAKRTPPPAKADAADLTAQHRCNDPATRNTDRGCAGWAGLLGRWRNVKYGGVIELYLEADNSMSARIVNDNERMRGYGYRAGTVFLRRLKLAPPSSLWSSTANQGQYFSAAMPGRKPSEQFGEAYWDEPALVYIASERPGKLELPATVGGRMANYEPWVRE